MSDHQTDEGARAGVIFDVDGTLLDTNFHHVVAWEQAFREAGHTHVDMAAIHRLIGRSSDDLVSSLLGEPDERVVEGHTRRFDDFRARLEVRPVSGASDLVRRCADAGLGVVLATSGSQDDLDWMLPALGVDDHLTGVVSSGDVENSKPAPDIFALACERHGLDPTQTIAVGDTVWDVEAARGQGLPCIGLTSGGIGREVLLQAGAVEVFDGPGDLVETFDRTRLGGLAEHA